MVVQHARRHAIRRLLKSIHAPSQIRSADAVAAT
jgi:hypothetical protein